MRKSALIQTLILIAIGVTAAGCRSVDPDLASSLDAQNEDSDLTPLSIVDRVSKLRIGMSCEEVISILGGYNRLLYYRWSLGTCSPADPEREAVAISLERLTKVRTTRFYPGVRLAADFNSADMLVGVRVWEEDESE